MRYIKKEKVAVVVYTGRYRVRGNIYIVPGTRLTDMLNVKVKDFVPLTEAAVLDSKENAVIAEIPYIAIYRDSIVAVHPLEEEDSLKQAEAASKEEESE